MRATEEHMVFTRGPGTRQVPEAPVSAQQKKGPDSSAGLLPARAAPVAPQHKQVTLRPLGMALCSASARSASMEMRCRVCRRSWPMRHTVLSSTTPCSLIRHS
ncbi:hypothetical protein CRUP_000251 [Coryphaenoides rupestris]|nr:hypothetical protein CRUP_000251 [Coryphaenoides rupestris]